MAGWRRCLQTMNCYWNFLENLRVHVVIPRQPKLLLLAPFTLHVCICTNATLDCSLSKHALDIQKMVAPVSNRERVLFLLIMTRNFAAYFILLSLILIISTAHDSHSESERSQGYYQDCQSHGIFDIFRIWFCIFRCICLTNKFINFIISVAWPAFVSVWVNCAVVVGRSVVFVSVIMASLVLFIWLFEIPSHFPCGI